MMLVEVLSPSWGRSKPSGFRLLQAALAVLLLCGVVAGFAVTPAQGAEATKPKQVLQGRLLFVKGSGPMVKTATKEYSLGGRYHYIFLTLEDKRLRNDEVRLKGRFQASGVFLVDNIYTIHHGDLYRIRYYCETCNIVALGPGKCVCCQKPTELQEVPLNKNDKKILITH